MFPRDPSESSRRQKRSPSPADHSGSNSSPSREYSPPAARRKQTSRAPAKSTTHKHNFSPSRRWEVKSVDFISSNTSGLETSSLGLTACLWVCCECLCLKHLSSETLCIFISVTTRRYVSPQEHKSQWKFPFISSSQMFGLQVELQKPDMRCSQHVSLWELSSSLTFPFFKKWNMEKYFTFHIRNRQSFSVLERVKWYTGPDSAPLSLEASTTG